MQSLLKLDLISLSVALRWTPSAMVDTSQSCPTNVSLKVELELRSFSGDGALRRRRHGGEGGC